jgi:8-amino-3,8-dideoxy-alpha-D-manno-octulosonate transaminase
MGKLALFGGRPVRTRFLPPMHPGASQYSSEEVSAASQVILSRSPYRFYGPEFANITATFEDRLKKYVGTKYALAVSSGTGALHAALIGIGVGKGDEVILPTYAWASCPSAIVLSGGIPILANVDDSLTLDPKDVEERITDHTKAIMAVHMRGAPCDMKSLKRIAEANEVLILEDVAQCFGGSYGGKKLGSMSSVGCYSFQINKMISAGEGGAITTDSKATYERSLLFHDVGTPYRMWEEGKKLATYPFPGLNYRANEFMSAILLEQLGRLDEIISRMRKTKRKIERAVSSIGNLQLRRKNDEQGEVGIEVTFFVDSNKKARKFQEALKAENIHRSSGMYPTVPYDPSRFDGHVFLHWNHIIKGLSRISKEYDQSLDLLTRAVHIDVSPLDTPQDTNDIIEAIAKIANSIG